MNEHTRTKILQSTTTPAGIRKLDRLRAHLEALSNIEPPPDYDRYIGSKAWKINREKFLAHYNHQCALCKKTDHLHVHHLHYQTIGSEGPEDVIVCCRRCHFIEHLPHNDDPNWAGAQTARHLYKQKQKSGNTKH